MLEQAISDYLLWMISKGYAQNTWDRTEWILRRFSAFVSRQEIPWEAVFTLDTLDAFKKDSGYFNVSAVRGLSRYLFLKERISRPIQKQAYILPELYEEYLHWCEEIQQVDQSLIFSITRVLSALWEYLQKQEIPLSRIKIEQLDAFLAEYNAPFSEATCRTYRSVLRGFLRYLYQEKGIIKKDFAPLLVGAPVFAQAKPPKFLRPWEVKKLFVHLETSSAKGLRTYAIVYLAYTLGLRPKEISLIRLDDISFSQGELSLKDRKNTNPIKLPLPEETIKAIAAYIVGARPNSSDRHLFLRMRAPYVHMSPSLVRNDITGAMRAANLPGSAYWLRHTYAQNLLESGASIFEIKQMLGHDKIQSSQRYIHINLKLMREVIFNETL